MNLTLDRLQGSTLFWCVNCAAFRHAPKPSCSCACCLGHALRTMRLPFKIVANVSRIVSERLLLQKRVPIAPDKQNASGRVYLTSAQCLQILST